MSEPDGPERALQPRGPFASPTTARGRMILQVWFRASILVPQALALAWPRGDLLERRLHVGMAVLAVAMIVAAIVEYRRQMRLGR